MKRAALALAALAGASVALAQQTTPPTTVEPRTSTSSWEQAQPPASPAARMSDADKQALLNKCVTQVQAANPNVPQRDIRNYCDEEIKTITSPR